MTSSYGQMKRSWQHKYHRFSTLAKRTGGALRLKRTIDPMYGPTTQRSLKQRRIGEVERFSFHLPPLEAAIRVVRVSKTFVGADEVRALDDVTFHVGRALHERARAVR